MGTMRHEAHNDLFISSYSSFISWLVALSPGDRVAEDDVGYRERLRGGGGFVDVVALGGGGASSTILVRLAAGIGSCENAAKLRRRAAG